MERELELELELEQPKEWLEEHENEVDPGTPTHTTYLEPEPEPEVREAWGMADEPPETATSPGYDIGPSTDTTPLEYEHPLLGHGMRSPDWEPATAADPGHDDEANAHGLVHAVHHAVEPHFDDTGPFKHGNSTLWDELRAADGDWTAEHEGGLEPYQEIGTGVYLHPNHSPPPSPTSFWLPQPPPTSVQPSQTPNTSRAPGYHYHYPASLLFPHYRPPRQRREYRPPRTPKMRRERYHLPRCTIGNKYGERGPPQPPNPTNRDWTRPRHPPRLPKVSPEALQPPNKANRYRSTSPGSWRERPPHLNHSNPCRTTSICPPTLSPSPKSLSNETPGPNRHRSTSPGSRRDRPSHPHPSPSTQRRSDSPNWRSARPGRPISFKMPSSPPMDSSTIPLLPPTSLKPTLTTLTTPNLDSLIKQAATALKNIIIIAEKLVRRANAERRISHRSSVVRLESARGRAWKRVS
jgi:hypothetical protein